MVAAELAHAEDASAKVAELREAARRRFRAYMERQLAAILAAEIRAEIDAEIIRCLTTGAR
jgi:hypothetical protein